MSKSPAFQFYSADFLVDTISWDIEEVGLYIRLLNAQWSNGPLPNDTKRLARITGCSPKKFQKVFKKVSEKFILLETNCFINQRLEDTRKAQEEYKEKQSEFGKLGAKVKAENEKKKEGEMARVAYRGAYEVASQNPSRVSQALHLLTSVRDVIVSGRGGSETFSKFFELFPGQITIQTFDDSTAKRENLTKILHFTGVIPEKISSNLQYLNENRAGIYMAINETDGKGRKKENIVKVRAIFVDLDGSPLAPAMLYDPTLVVESSKGRYHCYWFTDDMPLESFTTMQKTLIKKFKGDVKVHDLPRVLRVPGFYHHKGEPFLTKVISGSGKVYTFRELVEMFPPINPKTEARTYKLVKSGGNQEEYQGQYGTSAGDRNNHVLSRVGGMIKRGMPWDYIESEALKEGLACDPPLPEVEVLQILKSARRYARG